MKQSWGSILVFVFGCFAPGLSYGQSDFTLLLSDGVASECADAVVAVDLISAPSAENVSAWSLSVCSVATEVQVTSVDLGGDVIGLSPDFFTPVLYADGWTVGVVLSFMGLVSLPPGDTYELHLAYYSSSLPVGSSSTLAFCETVGTPTVEIVISDDGGATHFPDFTDLGSVLTVAPLPPANDDCPDAQAVLAGDHPFNLCAATTDGIPVGCDFGDAGPDDQVYQDVWFCYAADCDRRLTASTIASGLQTRIAVYDGCGCPASPASVLACSDGSGATFVVHEGQNYLIRVGTVTAGAPTGEGVLRISVDNACLVPEVGGVVQLPPECCDYIGPASLHLIIDGLPLGTFIQVEASHEDFLQVSHAPSPCGTTETFDSTVLLQLTGTGLLAGFERTLAVQLPGGQVCTGPIDPTMPVQTVDTEMLSLAGELTGDPDFESFFICAGSDMGLPSPGQLTLIQDPTDPTSYEVISQFQIGYCINFVGTDGGALEGLAGSTEGEVVMETGDPPGFRRGDGNDDGLFNIADAVFILNFLFVLGSDEPTCPDAADANDDGTVNIADGVFVLNRLFLPGSPPPPAPGPTECGPDPTFDELGLCEQECL